jgi:tRNA A37 threonylcarbamoyladenosine modification protein TsaB
MLKILIDANHRNIKTVSLLRDDEVIVKKTGDIDIVTEIATIMKEQNMSLEQVDSFEFENGGGSFTGLKTGAAIANVLQWAVKGTPINKLPVPEYGAEPNITPRPEK